MDVPGGWSRHRFLVGLLVVAASGLAGCRSPEEADASASLPRVVDTAVAVAANGPERITLSGEVQASEHSRLSFEVGGEVRTLAVDVGDPVTSGQTLAILDETRYQLVYDQAMASEKEAAAALREARLDYQRQTDLAERGFGSEARVDGATAALESARHRHEAAVASRRIAGRDLAQTRLKAPFEGTVSERRVEPSERVAAGEPVLTLISDRQGFEVETSVPETLVGRLLSQSEQQAIIPALGPDPVPARIHQIGSQPRSANNYPLTLILTETVPGLRSGMTARVQLALTPAEPVNVDQAAVAIPLTSLVYGAGGEAHVLRVGPRDRLQRVDLALLSTRGQAAIVSGPLAAGDRIVARGPEYVAEGDSVVILGESPERFH